MRKKTLSKKLLAEIQAKAKELDGLVKSAGCRLVCYDGCLDNTLGSLKVVPLAVEIRPTGDTCGYPEIGIADVPSTGICAMPFDSETEALFDTSAR